MDVLDGLLVGIYLLCVLVVAGAIGEGLGEDEDDRL
jgi:Na+-translocating ferredoxin:NAD+ oxidoreductase RnfE subunit